ncbi:MAG: oxygen-independent coproporphyrinogen III oxidase [Turneriella sp.]|nr:oxygen-independent coproporphyrinogen III oxidase [Turneriella sp.]
MLDNATVESLIARYNSPVPRYTSYPTALEFVPLADAALLDSYRKCEPGRPISVYIHLPFCENLCLYCGCNVLLSRKLEVLDEYIPLLLKELEVKTNIMEFKPRVSQLHFGGGTPNFLRLSDWNAIFAKLRERFEFTADAEISVELDPMYLPEGYLAHLRSLGMGRVSFGVQDVTPQVLEAVNRPQDISRIKAVVAESRALGYSSVNIDLIYGLPHQTLDSYRANLDFIADIRPDRIALFSYAHVPWLKHHQRRMDEKALTSPTEKLKIYLAARAHFLSGGYEQIGMDHFGLEDDSLTRAFREKTLHRNFMGYTTQKTLDMLAFGTSAIGFVSGVYMQNHLKLSGYRSAIETGKNWFEKGYIMSAEDRLRHEVITSLMANFSVNFEAIGREFSIPFAEHFAPEIARLAEFAQDGHGILSDQGFEATETGGFIIRHIASVFDAYRKASEQKAFSKAI